MLIRFDLICLMDFIWCDLVWFELIGFIYLFIDWLIGRLVDGQRLMIEWQRDILIDCLMD